MRAGSGAASSRTMPVSNRRRITSPCVTSASAPGSSAAAASACPGPRDAFVEGLRRFAARRRFEGGQRIESEVVVGLPAPVAEVALLQQRLGRMARPLAMATAVCRRGRSLDQSAAIGSPAGERANAAACAGRVRSEGCRGWRMRCVERGLAVTDQQQPHRPLRVSAGCAPEPAAAANRPRGGSARCPHGDHEGSTTSATAPAATKIGSVTSSSSSVARCRQPKPASPNSPACGPKTGRCLRMDGLSERRCANLSANQPPRTRVHARYLFRAVDKFRNHF